MISYNAKKSLIYSELEHDDRQHFFDFKKEKFIHNIDSLYYVVKVKNDWNNDPGCISFVSYLEKKKMESLNSFEPILMFDDNDLLKPLGTSYVMNGIGSKPYSYDIEKVDKYIIFITHTRLNKNTPEIWVQIRAQNLWLSGEYGALDESIKDLEKILSFFNIEIEEIKENRIDFAYHTNYIQDPLNFFKEKDLNRMQQSNFSRYSGEGVFVGQWEVDKDYITLGRKKSNNLFFRAYNKTKEVIEKGYKQFFIQIWYLERMINYFDYYCIERAFEHNSYKYLDIARLEFYLEFGTDAEQKENIKALLNAQSKNYEKIRELANVLVPKVTLIVNLEIETKRKFYYSLDSSIDALLKLHSKCPDYAKRLYLKLDNKKILHDFITCNNSRNEGIIRFIDFKAKNKNGDPWTRKSKFPTAYWWKRLQQVDLKNKYKISEVELSREYQKSLDKEKLKKRILNSMSTFKIYLHHEDFDSTFEEDVLDFISQVTENDTQDLIRYKQKKFTQLHNRLENLSKTDVERTLWFYDSENGELKK